MHDLTKVLPAPPSWRTAIGRAQAAATRQSGEPPIGDFVRLGPFGTAFPPSRLRRVLLIDELDKSEADLPNDLLRLFEEGESAIQELSSHHGDLRGSAMAFRR